MARTALSDRRLRDQERARNLPGCQTTEQAERESDARLSRENRMAGREHQAQASLSGDKSRPTSRKRIENDRGIVRDAGEKLFHGSKWFLIWDEGDA